MSILPKHQPCTAIVVGGGFGGIAAALRLRHLGYQVTIIERLSRLGGKAQVYVREGFRYDAGPVIITAPHLFEELFELHQKKMSDYIKLEPLNPWYEFQFADGSSFKYSGSMEDTLKEIAKFSLEDCQGYCKLLKASADLYEHGFKKMGHLPFQGFNSLLKLIPNLGTLRNFKSLHELASTHIQHPDLQKALSLPFLFMGVNPLESTGFFSGLHHLQRKWGVHFPIGGTGALVNAFQQLLEETDIKVQLNITVKQLLVEGGRAVGVELQDGQILKADTIVMNGDPAYVYKNMVPSHLRGKWLDYKLDNLKYSSGVFVLYFGTKKQYSEVSQHTFLLGKKYLEDMQNLSSPNTLKDPSCIYLHRPTATDPSFAPKNCDSFYALVPVPNLQSDINWCTVSAELRHNIITQLEKRLLPDLTLNLVQDFYLTPKDFQNNFLAQHGAAYSISPLFSQSACFRFQHRSKEIDGLYFVGAGTHPGPGLPGVLTSAKALATVIQEDKSFSLQETA
jgi:phytoene desaturase